VSSERYARQAIVPGWNQRRLGESHLLLVGWNRLSAAIAAGAVALGVGRLTLFAGTSPATWPADFLFSAPESGTTLAQALPAALRDLNPEVSVAMVTALLADEAQLLALSRPHAIIVASGDPADAEIAAACAGPCAIPLILARAGSADGACAVWSSWMEPSPVLAEMGASPPGEEPDAAVSCVIGGLALSEMRACLMPLRPGDGPSPYLLRYRCADPQRFSTHGSCGPVPPPSHPSHTPLPPYAHTPILPYAHTQRVPATRPHHVLLAGAGGLGTWFAVAACQPGFPVGELLIFDGDTIAATNMNRQILFAGAIGAPKASTMADRLRRINPQLQVSAVDEPVSRDSLLARAGEIDAVAAAVDSFRARALIQDACLATGTPLVSGGSGALQAEVAVSAPQRSACLRCALQIDRLAQAEGAQPASCAAAPEASTVIANMIAGGLMAAELRNLWSDPPDVPRAVLAYDALAAPRVGVRSERPPCRCFEEAFTHTQHAR
jgi:molybdopterin/thiamine biosynthesis adenylyltransferase